MDRNLQSNYILNEGWTRVYGDDSGEFTCNSSHRMSNGMSRVVMVDDTCIGSEGHADLRSMYM
jgi:hypothetical protein